MLLKIVYLLTCRVLGLAVLVFRGDRAKDAELLVLRHEKGIAQRVPDDERVAPHAAVPNVDTRQIRRKPVLGGLINEYMHVA